MHRIIFCSTLLCWSLAFSQDLTKADSPFQYPTYIGVMGGYGSTTWEGLVPAFENRSAAISISTPSRVDEGGAVWGVFAGYELSPYFAIEANYAHYPDANIFFDVDSLFAFENDGQTVLHTSTETVSLMAKVMLVIPHTTIRAFSSAGIARIQRADVITRGMRISPTFGAGLNYNFTKRIMGELGANYTAGYGESELNPATDYVPFLYAVLLKLAYRF